MIHLNALGTLDLRNPEGHEIHSVLSQPKRAALLLYLAFATPRGFHRRDSLLALFWPEADESRARGALNTAVYHLRRSLGADVLVNRGNEELGLRPGSVESDVVAFEEALKAGRIEEALELYRGDLLPGFFLSEAPEFERWLDRERARLRARAVEAGWQLAEQAEAAGELEAATRWARRAAECSPDDEHSLRRLIALLQRGGDRAAALALYEEFAQRLAREYEAEPAEETQALIESVRAAVPSPGPSAPPPLGPAVEERRSGGAEGSTTPPVSGADPSPLSRERERGLGGEVPVTPHAPRPTPHEAARALRSRPQRALLLLGVALLVSGTALFARLRSAPAVPVSPTTVAVLPFSYHGSGEHGYLAEGIARLLSTNLNGADELRSIDPRALLNALGREALEELDYRRGRRVAEQFGAGVYILGHIVESGDRLRITAVLYDRSGARPGLPAREVTVQGSGDQLFDLVDELTTRLLADRDAVPGTRLARLASLTTQSLPALRAYLDGEREYQVGRFAAALEHFARAVKEDSSFALAHYRLSTTATWVNPDPLAYRAAEAAVRHAGRLSEPDRLLVLAWNHYQQGGAEEAEQLLRRVLDRHPDHVEAWFQLAEVLFHWGPSLGRPATEAREAFERVLSFEPQNVGALIHLARIAALERRSSELDSLLSHISHLEPEGSQTLHLRALRAFSLGDPAAQAQVARQLAYADETTLHTLVTAIAVYTGNLAGAVELARPLLIASTKDPQFRARGHLRLAQLELARGRWQAAQAELAALERLEPSWAAEFRAAFSAFPYLRTSRGQLEAARAALAQVQHASDVNQFDRSYPPRRLYLLGLLSLRMGEVAAARDHIAALDRFQGTAHENSFARDFARDLRAQLAWTAGQGSQALEVLGKTRVQGNQRLPEIISYPKAHEHFLRAELLRSAGRDAEALRAYAAFPDPQGHDLIYLAPSHLRRAEIHERRGERQQAAEHYRRFVELWRDADPELQPLVRQARGRLEGR